MAEHRFRFRAAQRIRQSRLFEETYRQGRRVHRETLVLYGRPNALGYHRLGVTVSRKIGGAVVRNCAKRRLRAIFRVKLPQSGMGVDLVVNAKKSIATASFLEIQREFLDAFDRLSSQLNAGHCATTSHEEGPPKGI